MKLQIEGAWMEREIAEQPRLLVRKAAAWQEACDAIPLAGCDPIALIGRGSSGHACVFFSYLHGLATGRPTAKVRPWIATQATSETTLEGITAVAFSVSGESSDVAHAARWMKARGARVVAITNMAGNDSLLGSAADALVRLDAGAERAVPATKTFVAQLCVAAALAGFRIEAAAREAGDAIAAMLDSDKAERVADFLGEARTVSWLARGPALAVARDAALKLQEAAALPGQAYSSAEVLHGPIGALGPADRAVLLHDADAPADSMTAIATALLGRGVPTISIGGAGGMQGRSDAIVLPMPGARWARSMVFASLAQQVAFLLARRAGRNPDLPAGLRKITTTF